jgi:hypothetical protein
MLRERKELLEREIKRAHVEASNMYLSIVISGNDVESAEYQKIKERIVDLQFDLNMVNLLISKGQD